MALTAWGYEGEIPEQGWARMAYMLGSEWTTGKERNGDFFPRRGQADRSVTIDPGAMTSHGVTVVSDAVETVTLAPVASDSRWDTVCIERDWTPSGTPGGTTKIVALQGTASKALSGQMARQPGTKEHQPICLAQVVAGKTQVQGLEDLRGFAVDMLSVSTPLAVPSAINGQIISENAVPKVWRTAKRSWDTIGAAAYYRKVCADAERATTGTRTLATITIPDPGYPYVVEAWGRAWTNPAVGTQVDFRVDAGTEYICWDAAIGEGRSQNAHIMPGNSSPRTGATTVTLRAWRSLGTGTWSVEGARSVLQCKVVPA